MTQTLERRGWLGVLSVALGSFVLVLSEFLPIGLLPAIADDLGIGIGTAGLVVVATGLTAAISSPVVTVLTSRVDRRIVLLSLTALLVVADVVGALAPSFELLVVSRLLLGIALGGFWAIGAGMGSRLVESKHVIKATSVITAGVSVATVVSLPLGAFVAGFATWRLAFAIGAGLAILALAGQLLLLPSIPALERVRFRTLAGLLRIPQARVGIIATAFVFFAQFAAYTYVAPYLEDLVKVTAGTITVALLVFGIAGIAGNFVTGVALGRSIVATLIVGAVLLAASIALLPMIAGSVPGVFVLLGVWGFVWGGMPLGMQTWMANAVPGGSEGSLALFVTTIQLAIAAGSVVGGAAVSASGIGFDFSLAGAVALVGAVVLVTLGVRRGTRRPASVPAAAPLAAPVAVTTGAIPAACPE